MLNKTSDSIFNSRPPVEGLFARTFTFSGLALLFAAGLVHWMVFFHYGNMSFSGNAPGFDWPKELIHYSMLKAILQNPVIPYFVDPGGEAFLGNPEPILSPQIVLLLFMGVGKFILVNTLIMYTLGFLGCLLVRDRYRLSLVPFALLFLLFNFNGHITSHISAGHSMWTGYFLLPFVVYLTLELLRPDVPDKILPAALLSLVLLGIILQGSFHIYLWCLMFLGLVGLFNRHLRKEVVLAVTLSVWLALFRLVPAGVVFKGFQPSYASGFPSVDTFVDALTTIKTFTFEHPRVQGLQSLYDIGWWEHDMFIGYLGVAFLLFFGVYHRFSNHRAVQSHRFEGLDLPILLIVLFSFGFWFDIISDLKIPLVSWAERVPSRFFIIPLVTLVVISSIRLQGFMPMIRERTAPKLLLLAGLLQLSHGLMAHSWFWRVSRQTPVVDDPSLAFIFNAPEHENLFYTASVDVSAILSLGGLVCLIVLVFWRVRRQRLGTTQETDLGQFERAYDS